MTKAERPARPETYEETIARIVAAAPPFSPRQEAIIWAAFHVPSPTSPTKDDE